MSTQLPDSTAPLAVPPAVQAVLELFDAELANLKFPDVDRDVLQDAAQRVHAQAEALQRLEAALLQAREALHETQDALLHKCQRAVAYARIYAEEDRELSQKLDGISLPRSGRARTPSPMLVSEGAESRTPGRRGRRPAAASGALFVESAAAEPDPAAQAA